MPKSKWLCFDVAPDDTEWFETGTTIAIFSEANSLFTTAYRIMRVSTTLSRLYVLPVRENKPKSTVTNW